MTKPELQKYYAEEFIEAAKELHSEKRIDPNKVWSFKQLQILRDMAKDRIYPNGHFGDADCNVWSMFRSMMTD